MAKMIPAEVSPDTESQAEVKAFNLFSKAFDDSWTIFHSFRMQGENLEGKIIDAEADFVLFSKSHGLLVLEVKGGVVNFDGKGKCFQNGKKIKDPEYQARINKYNLEKIVKKRLHGDPQIKYAHAVYFPDTSIDISKLPPSYEFVTFTSCDTPYLQKNIVSLLSRKKSYRKREMSDGLANAVIFTLSPRVSLGDTILDRISSNRKTFNILTEIQVQILKFISKRKHAFIEGYAGTGKTVLAIKKARQLAMEGNKVLFLCYNNLLGKRLKVSVKDLSDLIDAGTYHEFCFKILEEKLTLDDNDFRKQDTWEKLIPELTKKHLSENPLKYDAVIIDEAQDFKEGYWLTLLEQYQEDKYFYLFFDPSQNIFSTQMTFPEAKTPFTLTRVCRNTKSIFEYLQEFTDRQVEIFEEMPIGKEVEVFVSDNSKERLNYLRKLLDKLINKENLNSDNIVILGAHSYKNTILPETNKSGEIIVRNPLEDNLDAKKSKDKKVDYYTYMKFKGCEADVVILLDVDKNDPRWKNNGIYTAASRAKNMLYIIKK